MISRITYKTVFALAVAAAFLWQSFANIQSKKQGI
jgi:hypothetical protein